MGWRPQRLRRGTRRISLQVKSSDLAGTCQPLTGAEA